MIILFTAIKKEGLQKLSHKLLQVTYFASDNDGDFRLQNLKEQSEPASAKVTATDLVSSQNFTFIVDIWKFNSVSKTRQHCTCSCVFEFLDLEILLMELLS